jgi:hypothetical protein
MYLVGSYGHEHSSILSHLLDSRILHCTVYYPIIISSFTFTHSVLVLSITPWFDLSGKTSAIWSIFLNCHGKRDGYRNGRKSNPVGEKGSEKREFAPIQLDNYDYHLDCRTPVYIIVGFSIHMI